MSDDTDTTGFVVDAAPVSSPQTPDSSPQTKLPRSV